MKILIKILKWFLYFLLIPISYFIISLVLTYISVNTSTMNIDKSREVYLGTNGIHLNIIIPYKYLSPELKKYLVYTEHEKYFSFGWGDENFYLNTPTWDDLTFANACKALFLKSTTLIHLTRYTQIRSSWTKVELSKTEIDKLTTFISSSFMKDINGNKIILVNAGYSTNDNFYKALGSYSCFNTCNTWVNDAFKESGLKSCLWTPFDFGLIAKYE